MSVFLYFLLALKASLFSSGGSGNIPSLHADLVPSGVATDAQFGESMAVGMISPGPTGLWVLTLGYLLFGVAGALASLTAVLIPPFLVIPVEKIYTKHESRPAVDGFVRGLGLAIVGVSFVVLTKLLSGAGVNALSIAIAAGAVAIAATRRAPLPVILVMGAIVGLLARHV